MKFITVHARKLWATFLEANVFLAFIVLLILPTRLHYEKEGNNIYSAYVNDVLVGNVSDARTWDELLREARYVVVQDSQEMVLMDYTTRLEGYEIAYGTYTDHDVILSNIISVMEDSRVESVHPSYTLKIDQTLVNLSTIADVKAVLNEALSRYDTDGEYSINLTRDPDSELPVLIATAVKEEAEVEETGTETKAGLNAALTDIYKSTEATKELEFQDYDYGIINISFAETVEIVEGYLLDSELTTAEEATSMLLADQETEQIYEVVSGDTLTKIANSFNLTIDDLLALNTGLESANSTIRIGDRLIITVPEPELSVIRQEEVYYEGSYEAAVIYVDNDNWYTTQQQTLQEPSSGYRKVVAVVTYRNDTEIDREIIMENIVTEAVPKIVERGTKTPPTYIKPISGGTLSSGFGYRSAPTAGATTYHKGVDWATNSGTVVVASCGGKVTQAGWMGSYGYVVFIDHPDGRQTRYAHLSKIYVKVGQTVKQGEKIALTGNSGRTTGPHLHFEMRINGTPVNPLLYLN